MPVKVRADRGLALARKWRQPSRTIASSGRLPPAAAVVAVALAAVAVGVNMRGPVVGIPPLIGPISRDFDLSPTAAGLLTSIPLLCFAAASPAVSMVGRRLGADRTILLSLIVLGVALLLRPWGSLGVLLLGTVAVGIAITAGSVLAPMVVRRDSGARVAGVSALLTASYGIGAAVASGSSVFFEHWLGWRAAVALLAVPAAAAAIIWVVTRRFGAIPEGTGLGAAVGITPDAPLLATAQGRAWTTGAAWWLAVFFGLQCVLFYATSAWLPAILDNLLISGAESAATAITMFHLVGVAGMLSVPLLLKLSGSFALAGILSSLGWMALFAGIAIAPQFWPVAVLLGGWGNGVGISLALTMVAVRPRNADHVQGVSAMVQTVGYTMAAVAPVALGWFIATVGDWTAALWACETGAVVTLLVGIRACNGRAIL